MAKRDRGFNRKKYEKWIKEGRGDGIGKDYKPWLTIHDVASAGNVTRIRGIKNERQHHLLSNNERNCFYIFDYADFIVDIREQFPLLPIEQTIALADELQLKHPTDPVTHENIVMTTDFLLTAVTDGQEKLLARTFKECKDLNDERQIQKFEIERRYWKVKGIDSWAIITEKDIDKVVVDNIAKVHGFYYLDDLEIFSVFSNEQVMLLIETFKKEISGKNISIREKAKIFDEKMMLKPGTGISIFKHLLISKQISIDLSKSIDLDCFMDIKII